LFQIEGHPNWLLRGHFIDGIARADAYALCRELYKRASYYLSPASMLWWVLARGRQVRNWTRLANTLTACTKFHRAPLLKCLSHTPDWQRAPKQSAYFGIRSGHWPLSS
jgi:hypothetical protein